jgi:hypothetical protein
VPNDQERLQIYRIHFHNRGVAAETLGIDRLKQFTRGWTGAEIEQCVVSALTTAKLENRELTGDDLLNQTGKIVPLSKTMKEQVEHIRSWALDRAIRTAPRVVGASDIHLRSYEPTGGATYWRSVPSFRGLLEVSPASVMTGGPGEDHA